MRAPAYVNDSQSGREMIVPGSQGIRLHLSDGSGWGEQELKSWIDDAMRKTGSKAFSKARLVSFECPIILMHSQLGLGLTPVVPVSSLHELEELARARDKGHPSGGSLANLIPQFSTKLCTTTNEAGNLKTVTSLIRSSVAIGFTPRSTIKSAWKSGNVGEIDDDDDENLHQSLLSTASVEIADAGCDVICFSDDLSEATSESLRAAVEEAFGLDVLGETMMERLSVRLSKKHLVEKAKELGVTRFDVNQASLEDFL